jgi:hypothetical protein
MSDVINVYIPDGPNPPRVQSDFSTASGGEMVIWKIFNANPEVQEVEIRFQNPIHYFDPPEPHSLRKPVPPGTCAVIHGKVPLMPAGNQNLISEVRSDKYDIIGRGSGSVPVPGVELDPEIIVKVP